MPSERSLKTEPSLGALTRSAKRSTKQKLPNDGSEVIPLSVPNVGGDEWTYVKECLDTGWVSSAGRFVDRFEEEFASAVGASHAVSTSSGTAALHLALIVQGIESGDEVIMPSLTFIAPANAVRYVGAWPTFVDVDRNYWQLDPDAVERFLRDRCDARSNGLYNRQTGRRVTAILPVHLLGTPVNMGPIRELAREFGLTVIEDATESLGGSYGAESLGSRSRTACFSFNGNKLITTGGGGMLTTDDELVAKRVKYLSTQAKDDPIEFVHGAVGFNYRLTNVQAALGIAQLERLPEFLETKRRIAGVYTEALKSLPGLSCMEHPPWGNSAFWLYTVVIDPSEFGLDSRQLMKALGQAGVESRPLWQPLHLSPALRGAFSDGCDTAEILAARCLSLPCSTGLSDRSQARVIESVRTIAQRRER
jgi:perosamine synthetase